MSYSYVKFVVRWFTLHSKGCGTYGAAICYNKALNEFYTIVFLICIFCTLSYNRFLEHRNKFELYFLKIPKFGNVCPISVVQEPKYYIPIRNSRINYAIIRKIRSQLGPVNFNDVNISMLSMYCNLQVYF